MFDSLINDIIVFLVIGVFCGYMFFLIWSCYLIKDFLIKGFGFLERY